MTLTIGQQLVAAFGVTNRAAELAAAIDQELARSVAVTLENTGWWAAAVPDRSTTEGHYTGTASGYGPHISGTD